METRETIIDSIRVAYPHVDNCLLHSSQDERVIDVPVNNANGKRKTSKADFAPDQIKPGFDVNNPNHHSFSLLQIDGKLMGSDIEGIGQCDCAIICDREISFVELKTDAVTDKLNGNCEKAESQLFMTMMRMNWAMRQVKKDFLGLANINAYVCFNSYPKANVNFQNRQLKFFKKTGVPLYYNNVKTL